MQTSIDNLDSSEFETEASGKPAGKPTELFAFPATPQQKQLWFLDQLHPGNAAYNIPLAYEVRGFLNLDALDRSLQWVVNRHENFRTIFSLRGDDFTQLVQSE